MPGTHHSSSTAALMMLSTTCAATEGSSGRIEPSTIPSTTKLPKR